MDNAARNAAEKVGLKPKTPFFQDGRGNYFDAILAEACAGAKL